MKQPRACKQCRETKRRCRRRGPGEACDTCRRRDLVCDGDLRRRNFTCQILLPKQNVRHESSEAIYPTASLDTGSLHLPDGMAVEMVEHYLEKINNGRPHSLFHPATLRSQLHKGTIKAALLYALCAVGSKFSANPDVRRWETPLAAESKRLLQLDIENVCIEAIQTCILICTLNVDLSNSSEALYHRIAITMADILRLDSSSSTDSLIVSEMKKRIWWTLYMADSWCVFGLGLLRQIKDTQTSFDLPMNEAAFLTLSPDQTSPSSLCTPGSFARLIQLSQLFRPIQNLNRQTVEGMIPIAQLDHEVELLAQQLEDWKTELSPEFELNSDSLHLQQEKGAGGSFIVMHLAYHHFATLLYFRFLENPDTTSPTYVMYVKRCKMHASSFSTLLRRARQLKGCEPMFPLIGHMTTVCSSVLLHTLLFGDIEELEGARRELNANFEALIELKEYWPGTAATISRLITFQDICLLCTEVETHKLDGWMLRYLLERPLIGRADLTPVVPPSLHLGSDSVLNKAKDLTELGRYTEFQNLC